MALQHHSFDAVCQGNLFQPVQVHAPGAELHAVLVLHSAQDREALRRYTATGFWASIVFGLVFALACFVCITPLPGFLGATEETWTYTRSYLLSMAAGAPIVLLIPLLYLMEHFFGLIGLALAHTAADAAAILITGIMALHYYRKVAQ